MSQAPVQIAAYATALIAALAIYGMFDQFSFDHPILTVALHETGSSSIRVIWDGAE